MPERILQENWEDYNHRKNLDWLDSRYFAGEEPWEVDYLLSKIRLHKPEAPEEAIRLAISTCTELIPVLRPREKFVACVMSRLEGMGF